MSVLRRTWVISYDIVGDRRRARLCKLLESKGLRVQYSVFEVLASSEELDEIVRAATKPRCFDASEDSLRCYALCDGCRAAARAFGRAAPPTSADDPVVV